MFSWAIRIGIFLVGATLLLDGLEAFSIVNAFPVTPNKLFTVMLLGLAVMYWLVMGGRLPRNRKTKWLIAFYFSLGISSAYAVIQGVGFIWIFTRWTTFVSMFVFFYLLLFVLNDRKNLDTFIFGMMVSGLIATASALLLEGSGGYNGPVRRSGIGSGENQAAGNLLMLLPFIFALSYKLRSLFKRVSLQGIAVVLVIGFAVALSRSAFLAALAMGGMWALRMRRLRDLRIVFAGLALVMIAYFVAPEGYAERVESLLGIFDSTRAYAEDEIGYRANIYRTSVIAFMENPLIGVGIDQFVVWAGQRDASMIGGHAVHNAILSVAANQGVLGLVPYMALLFLTFFDFSRVQAVIRAYRPLGDVELEQLYVRAVAGQVAFIGIMVVAMFQPGTFWRGIWALFAISTVLVELTRRRLDELGAGQPAGPAAQAASGMAESPPSPIDPLLPSPSDPLGSSDPLRPGQLR